MATDPAAALSSKHAWLLWDDDASRHFVFFAALFLLLYAVNLFVPRDLWIQDEARYGEVVREMMSGGSWLVPHLNGHFYPDKPPFYFWLIAGVSALVGEGQLAFRLVSAVSTALAIAGVYQLGAIVAGRRAGFWSAAIFATAFLTLLVGQIARMDMLLTALVAYAWVALVRFHRDARNTWLAGFWLLSALTLTIKGPIGLLYTLVPGLVWMFADRGWQGFRAARPLVGVAAIGALVALWIAIVIGLGEKDYLATIWNQQLVGRAVNSWSHREPFYFYLLLLPLALMPWTGVIVRGGYRLYKDRLPGAAGIGLFALLPLLAISLVSGKLFVYLEPLFPALALAGGVPLAKAIEEPAVSKWTTWPPVLFLAVCAGGLFWLARTYPIVDAAGGYTVSALLGALAVIGAVLSRFTLREWLYGWLAISLAASWLIFGAGTHVLNPLFSGRALGEYVSREVPADATVAVIHDTRGILNVYARRLFVEVDIEDAAAWLKEHRYGALIVKTSHLEQLGGIPATACRTDKTFFLSFKEYHVLSSCGT